MPMSPPKRPGRAAGGAGGTVPVAAMRGTSARPGWALRVLLLALVCACTARSAGTAAAAPSEEAAAANGAASPAPGRIAACPEACDGPLKYEASRCTKCEAARLHARCGGDLPDLPTLVAPLAPLLALARRRAGAGGQLVVTFASNTYMLTLFNWLHSATAAGVANYVVVALDNKTHRSLQLLGVPSFYSAAATAATREEFGVPLPGGKEPRPVDPAATFGDGLPRGSKLAFLWGYRILVLHALLRAGLTVLHTDIDVVLLRDPLPVLAAVPGDVVVQGGSMPRATQSRLGRALCMGFMLLRPTAATLLWFRMGRAFFGEYQDDQVAFNRALSDCTRVRWTTEGDPRPRVRIKDSMITGRAAFGNVTSIYRQIEGPFCVSLLASQTVPRRTGPCSLQAPSSLTAKQRRRAEIDALASTRDAVAIHCNSMTGSQAQSNRRLKMSGLLFVDKGTVGRALKKLDARLRGQGGGGAAAAAVPADLAAAPNTTFLIRYGAVHAMVPLRIVGDGPPHGDSACVL